MLVTCKLPVPRAPVDCNSLHISGNQPSLRAVPCHAPSCPGWPL